VKFKIFFVLLFFSIVITGVSEENTEVLEQTFPELKGLQTSTSSSERKPKLIEISSKSLRGKGKFLIYLPPGYTKNDRKYPVVYFLHGLGDNCSTWLDGEQNVAQIVTILIERGEIQPMILIVPEGEKGFWMNFPDASKLYEDWVVKDLRKYVEKNYRTLNDRGHRAIMGVSMGGFGALKIGFRYPEIYGYICAITPALPPPAQWSTGYLRQNHPWWLVVDRSEKLKNLRTIIKCGSADGYYEIDNSLVSLMNEKGLFCDWQVYEGMKHDAVYFVKSSVDGLKQISKYFAGF